MVVRALGFGHFRVTSSGAAPSCLRSCFCFCNALSPLCSSSGFLLVAQWVASLCGIIAGSVLLCCFQKPVYTCVAINYVIAAIFDLIAAILW